MLPLLRLPTFTSFCLAYLLTEISISYLNMPVIKQLFPKEKYLMIYLQYFNFYYVHTLKCMTPNHKYDLTFNNKAQKRSDPMKTIRLLGHFLHIIQFIENKLSLSYFHRQLDNTRTHFRIRLQLLVHVVNGLLIVFV